MALKRSTVIILTIMAAGLLVVIILAVGLAICLPNRVISDDVPGQEKGTQRVRESNNSHIALGLEFWPKPEDSDSSLIKYRVNDSSAVRAWATRIDGFFDEYRGIKPESRFRVECSPRAHLLRGDEVCDVKILSDGPCAPRNLYGYNNGSPCVFLRLTQRSGWVPEPYNTTDRLPPDMPEDLKLRIRNSRDIYVASQVWVSCEGENSADKENIGPAQYFPDRGFPVYYFPYINKPGYLSPYVAVHFERIQSGGVLVNVECRAWAHNIQYDRYQRRSSVHFEIMVE